MTPANVKQGPADRRPVPFGGGKAKVPVIPSELRRRHGASDRPAIDSGKARPVRRDSFADGLSAAQKNHSLAQPRTQALQPERVYLLQMANIPVLRVGGIRELTAANAPAIQNLVSAALTDTVKIIELDLSQTVFMDSCGLGVLIAFRNASAGRRGVVRVLNPALPARRILEMTRLHRVLEVVNSGAATAG
jgi:anti-anti-sigma factor